MSEIDEPQLRERDVDDPPAPEPGPPRPGGTWTTRQTIAVVCAIISLACTLLALIVRNTTTQEDVRNAADAAASDLGTRTYHGLIGPTLFDVQDAVERSNVAGSFDVKDAGGGTDGKYVITTDSGADPVCLTVHTTSPDFGLGDDPDGLDDPSGPTVTTSVDDGRC